MKLLKIICIQVLVATTLQAIELHNRSNMPIYITQITLASSNGLDTVETIESMHITINPGQIVSNIHELIKQKNAVITQLSLTSNTISYHFTIRQNQQKGSITINPDGAISTSPEIELTAKENLIPHQKDNNRSGPRLI